MNTQFTHDTTLCHDLSEAQIEGHHPLCDLASEAGYASLRSLLNDLNLWGATVAEVAKLLTPPPPYHTTRLYKALLLTLSHKKASHVMHLLNYEVPERKQDASPRAKETANMLLRLTPAQRDAWAENRIAERNANNSATQARLAAEWLERWAAMTDENRVAYVASAARDADEVDAAEELLTHDA
jgi:hypothetical protein